MIYHIAHQRINNIVYYIFIVAFTIAAIYGIPGLAATVKKSNDREQARIDFAKNAILFGVINSSNWKGAHACSDKNNAYACAGPDRAELGMTVLESSNSIAAAYALVDISAYKMDGAIGENYSEAVCRKGKNIANLFKKSDPDDLKLKCEKDANYIISSSDLYKNVDIYNVCLDSDSIKIRISENLDMLNRAPLCSP
jgi:hypothetical protein